MGRHLPEQIAAELDARHPEWAVLFGHYSKQFVALPLVVGGLLAAKPPAELERRIAQVRTAPPARPWAGG